MSSHTPTHIHWTRSHRPAVDQEGGGVLLVTVAMFDRLPQVHQGLSGRHTVVWPRGVVVLGHVTARLVLGTNHLCDLMTRWQTSLVGCLSLPPTHPFVLFVFCIALFGLCFCLLRKFHELACDFYPATKVRHNNQKQEQPLTSQLAHSQRNIDVPPL